MVCELRKLMGAMIRHFPFEDVRKNGVLCAGGDCRVKSNRWLYDSLASYTRKGRLCRESKICNILALLEFKRPMCQGPSCHSMSELRCWRMLIMQPRSAWGQA